jgi:hypothetical protein
MFFFEYSPSRHKPATAQKGKVQVKPCSLCLSSVYPLQLTDLPLFFLTPFCTGAGLSLMPTDPTWSTTKKRPELRLTSSK